MPNIQIKDVPDETHEILTRRAKASHQSLQAYLRSKLIRDAERPTLDEVLDRVDLHTGGSVSLEVAVEAVRSERASR